MNLVSQDCRIFSILNHGLEPVGVFHKLVCRATVPLMVILSSSEFFLVTPKFSVVLPYCDEPIIIIITSSTYSCTKSLHGAWGSCSEFLKSFSLIVQSFHHCPSDRSRLRISLSIFHMKRVSSFITARTEQTHIAP
jgi:hypothetical protein